VSTVQNFTGRVLTVLVAVVLIVAGADVHADKGRRQVTDLVTKTTNSVVDRYLAKDLEVDDISDFNVSRRLLRDVRRGLTPDANIQETSDLGSGQLSDDEKQALLGRFSKQSYKTLAKVVRAIGREEYNNAILLGPAGVGKTFTRDQLVALFSFGVFPEELKQELGWTTDKLSNYTKEFLEAYIGNTRFFVINDSLLTIDNTPPQKAFAKADQRMKKMLADLFNFAEEDFRRHGVRTVFFFEEVATLPDVVQPTLKSLLDKTGFKNPKNLLARGSEIGVSTIPMTTPDEYRAMIRGDAAIERRYEPVFIQEPSEEEAFKILMGKVPAYQERFGLTIGDEVVEYLVAMRKFFNNPPQAMPASVLNALNDLFIWADNANNRFDPDSMSISMEDAYAFMIEKAQLPKEIWNPEGNKVPLADLEEHVKQHLVGEDIVGHNGVLERLLRRLKTGRSTGFRETPVFIVMGPPGSGKDTIAQAVNREMFGHDGRHLMFSVAGNHGAAFSAIIEGAPRGSSSDSEAPLLVQALKQGPQNGLIVFNEAKDLPSEEFEKLKTIVETGEIRPRGIDARARPLNINPIFIMGQWGEELFENKSEEEIRSIYEGMTEQKLIEILTTGKDKGKTGAVPMALIQRALRTGGIYFLPPVAKEDYIHIVRQNLGQIKENFLKKSRIKLEVDPEVEKFIVKLAHVTNRGTRGLLGLTADIAETVVSVASDNGFPARIASYKLELIKAQSGAIFESKIKITWTSYSPHKSLEFMVDDLLRSNLKSECGAQLL
jgi:ATP-dependent Clp protease ATP-binding subunit ClpA